jgi:hypothetical protein
VHQRLELLTRSHYTRNSSSQPIQCLRKAGVHDNPEPTETCGSYTFGWHLGSSDGYLPNTAGGPRVTSGRRASIGRTNANLPACYFIDPRTSSVGHQSRSTLPPHITTPLPAGLSECRNIPQPQVLHRYPLIEFSGACHSAAPPSGSGCMYVMLMVFVFCQVSLDWYMGRLYSSGCRVLHGSPIFAQVPSRSLELEGTSPYGANDRYCIFRRQLRICLSCGWLSRTSTS